MRGQASAKQPSPARTDYRRSGYRYAEDWPPFFIKDNGVWTGVLLEASSDEFDSVAEQEQSAGTDTKVHTDLLDLFAMQDAKSSAKVQCHEVLRYQPIDTSDWRKRYNNSHWDPSDLFTALIDEKVEPHIADSTPVRQRYLLVRIGDQKAPVNISPAAAIVDADEQVSPELFTAAELATFRQKAKQVVDRLAMHGATPMTRADLAWLIRKPLSGKYPVAVDREYDRTRFVRNGWFDEITRFDGVNLKSQAAVQINNPDPASADEPDCCYTATLTVDTGESQVPFQYWNAWGKLLRTLPCQPEISWRYTLVDEAQFAKAIKKATRLILDEVNDRTKDGNEQAINDSKFGALAADAEVVQDDMTLYPRPGMIGQLRITISAWTLTELAAAEQQVRDAMKDFAALARKKRIQYALLEEQLPGDVDATNIGQLVIARDAGGGIDLGTRYTDVDLLGMARLDSSPTVGDDTELTPDGETLGWHGHVIGYTEENGSIVHFDPFVPLARNSGAGTAIIGKSGGGKSSLAMCLFFWMSESGVQCVVLDPKNDFERFILYIAFGSQLLADGFMDAVNDGTAGTRGSPFQPINEQFWRETRLVSLTHGNNGSLGAWVLTQNYEDGEKLARQQIEQLLAGESESTRRTVEKAFDRLRADYMKRRDTDGDAAALPDLSDLERFLDQDLKDLEDLVKGDKTAQVHARSERDLIISVRNRLHRGRSQEYARLMFGTAADNDAIRGINHRRTVITMVGFSAPDDPDVSKWHEAQHNAAAAMFTVLWQVEKVFSSTAETISPNKRIKQTRPRALFVDEGYIITAFAAGRALLKRALRQGRSLYFAVIFMSQQADDIKKIEDADKSGEETDQNQFSTVFVFLQKGMAEAKAALRLLRSNAEVDTQEENTLATRLLSAKERGGTLSTGVCVKRDCDGRVGTVQIDPILHPLWVAAETNPSRRAARQSENPPSTGSDWTVETFIRDRTRGPLVRGAIEDTAAALTERFEYDEADDFLLA